jgi:HlyD family secretion protein
MNKKLLPVLCLLVTVPGVALGYLSGVLKGVQGPPAATAEAAAAPAGERPSPEWVQGVGYVEPESEVHRLFFKVDGVIGQCPARPGDVLKKGDVVMALDDRDQRVDVAVAEAELELARARRCRTLAGIEPFAIAAAADKVDLLREQLRYADKEYDRNRGLLHHGAVSDFDNELTTTARVQREAQLRQAEAEFRHLKNYVRPEDRELADAEVRCAEARLGQARQRLWDTVLTAPFDGTVVEVLKREGDAQRVIDPQPVAVFADLRRLRIRVEIDERYARGVRAGQRAVAFGRSLGDETVAGRVVLVKQVMGKKTVFAQTAEERLDLDVLQVLIEPDGPFAAPAGLRVDVKVAAGD